MIGAGDTVMVVYSCCSAPPYNPGWVGKRALERAGLIEQTADGKWQRKME